METSKQLIGETLFDLTSYAAATPANPLALQENAKVKTTPVICGLGLEKPLASYDLNTQSWKMLGVTYLWGDCPLLENLPKSGMTRNGELFLQPAWEPITDVIESSSWPTPRNCSAMAATMTSETAHNPKRFPNLETVVGRRQWPTPTTQDHIERKSTQQKPGSMHSVGLGDAVRKWATPTARDGKGASNYQRQSRNEADLTNQARAQDGVESGSLNPTWVEWLMGFPLGWTDLEDSETP